MSRRIDYYFSLLSPWAYIGHAPFMQIVARHDCVVDYRPMVLGNVFAETGGLPLAKRHPVRQRYRMVELQRWREKRGLEFHLHPAHWPFDVATADRLVIALGEAGHDVGRFMRLAFDAIWLQQRNLADAKVRAELLREMGLDAEPLLSAAERRETAERYVDNELRAIASDVFGSPAYVLDGEVFWGQDRLDLLDDALATGRPPFRPNA